MNVLQCADNLIDVQDNEIALLKEALKQARAGKKPRFEVDQAIEGLDERAAELKLQLGF